MDLDLTFFHSNVIMTRKDATPRARFRILADFEAKKKGERELM